MAPTMLPTSTPEATQAATSDVTQVTNCANDLRFLEDLSFPDGTQVNPGKKLEKEWQVRNTGSCNWNESYTVRFISGSELGAEPIQALVPARNGADAVIRIEFTAPTEPGRYTSTWQAYGPNDASFGEWFSIEIVVTSP